MKKFALLIIAASLAALATSSCKKTEVKQQVFDVKISLTDEKQENSVAESGVGISVKSGSATFESKTDESGTAYFQLATGIYEVSASFKKGAGSSILTYNGSTKIDVSETAELSYKLAMVESISNSVIIKEYYFGGITSKDGKAWTNDQYIILYNNSAETVDISNIAISSISPSNSNSSNPYLQGDGSILYMTEHWVPALWSCWWFRGKVTLEPYSQIVLVTYQAIDHTSTYPESVNLANADYYALYDTDVFAAGAYVAPDQSIPTSHYLKTINYGIATLKQWVTSNTSPGLFIFEPKTGTVSDFLAADTNFDQPNTAKGVAKVPEEWVLDGVEVYDNTKQDEGKNNKRFSASIDAGYVLSINKQGYSVYRNVDKEATEALPENEGKLVYYSAVAEPLFTNAAVDPSLIDAEASIAAGAHIIYKDTNNSSNDFNLRKFASLHVAAKE